MDTNVATKNDRWEIDASPRVGDVLALALWPDEALHGATGRQAIERVMAGVGATKQKIVEVDGFGYTPENVNHLDINLVMLAVKARSFTVLQDWVERFGVDILNHCNSILWSPVIFAIASHSAKMKDYVLSLQGIEFGLPEVAALGRKDITYHLVKEYDALPVYKRPYYGLEGKEIAFLFSALSGDLEWFMEWMTKVEDSFVFLKGTNVCLNALSLAVQGGNTEMVRMLFQKGFVDEPEWATESVLHSAVHDVSMVKFLVEEMKLSLDTISESRSTILGSALLDRRPETCQYLLEEKSADEWAALEFPHPLNHAIFRWLPPSVCKPLIDTLSKGSLQVCLNDALEAGNYQMVDCLMEKGASLSIKVPKDALTPLESAVFSGSVKTVELVYELVPDSIDCVHPNGFHCLVAAVLNGDPSVFLRVIQLRPNLLQSIFWDDINVFMLAAQRGCMFLFDIFLEDHFYESHCRGTALDANKKSSVGLTTLAYAVGAGKASLVDKILSRRSFLRLTECSSASAVSKLFESACQSQMFGNMLDCFDRHGIRLTVVPQRSLSLVAAKAGVLVNADTAQVNRLHVLDSKHGMDVSDEVLIGEAVAVASSWVVESGQLAKFLHRFYGDKSAQLDECLLKSILQKCDVSTGELFLDQVMKLRTNGAIVQAFEGFGECRSVPHALTIHHRRQFVLWLIDKTEVDPVAGDSKALSLIKSVVGACVDLDLVTGLLPEPPAFSESQLGPVIIQASESCQFGNTKHLICLLNGSSSLSAIKGEDGLTVLTAALSDSKEKRGGPPQRLPLIRWLIDTGAFDLSADDDKGVTVAMHAARLGNFRVLNFLRSFFDRSTYTATTKDDESLLKYACDGGHPKIVEWVLSVVDAEESLGRSGETSVHFAAAKGHFALLRYLIEQREFDAEQGDIDKRTALDYSHFCENENVKRYLHAVCSREEEDSIREEVNELLRVLSRSIGKNLSLNSNGICAFNYEGHVCVLEVPQQVGSCFVYSIFDGQKYEVTGDTWENLIRFEQADREVIICPSLDVESCKDKQYPDVVLSMSLRIREISQTEFQRALEYFIETVLQAAGTLSLCLAQRILRENLLQPDGTPYVLPACQATQTERLVADYTMKTPKRSPLSRQEVEIFKVTMTPFVEELREVVGHPAFHLNENGNMYFTYNALLFAIYPVSADRFAVSCAVWSSEESRTVSSTFPHEVLRNALSMNLLQQKTRGAVLRATNREKIELVYEDSINDIAPQELKNVLENFIETAISISTALVNTRSSAGNEVDALVPDWTREKVSKLQELVRDPSRILCLVYDLPSDKFESNLESCLSLISSTDDLDVWYLTAKMALNISLERGEHQRDTTIKIVLKKSLEHGLLSDALLSILAKAAPSTVLSEGLTSVLISKECLKRKEVVSTQKQLIATVKGSGALSDEEIKVVLKKDLSQRFEDTILFAESEGDFDELINCLDFFGEHLNLGESDKQIRRLIHVASSKGSVKLAKALIERFEMLTFDELSLTWACKSKSEDLVALIIKEEPSLPRENAMIAASSTGALGSMKLLGIGSTSGASLLDQTGTFLVASQTAIAGQKWEVLELLAEDTRLDRHLRQIFDYAWTCHNHAKAIQVLIKSSACHRMMYSIQLPWQTRVEAEKQQVLPLLFVRKEMKLTQEITERIWSFSKPEFEESPLVATADDFWSKAAVALARDMCIDDITRDESRFDLPGIGQLAYNGSLRIQKCFDIAKGTQVTPKMILSLSECLGGCYLATNKLEICVYLKKVIPLDPKLSYDTLRSFVKDFNRAAKIFRNVLDQFSETATFLSVRQLSYADPGLLDYVATGESWTNARGPLQRSCSHVRFDKLWPKRIRVSQEMEDQESVDQLELLARNMFEADEVFYARSSSGKFCVCTFVAPETPEDDPIYGKLDAYAGPTTAGS